MLRGYPPASPARDAEGPQAASPTRPVRPTQWGPTGPLPSQYSGTPKLAGVAPEARMRSQGAPVAWDVTALEEAPVDPPENPGIVGNTYICLPPATTVLLGVKPNMNDKTGDESGRSPKTIWWGRAWQLRKLLLNKYRRDVLAKQPPLTWRQKKEIDEALKDDQTRERVLRVQRVWRGATVRSSATLATIFKPIEFHLAPYAGAILFMHGSGGMESNEIRYSRFMAHMGYIIIAPDSMAGGEYRKRNIRAPFRSEDPTPYWGDLGLYTTKAEGELTYCTNPEAVCENPERWKQLYENVFRLRSAEMNWILGRLPTQMKLRGVFTMGDSEGGMAVARFDDSRYGAMIRGRIISAYGAEYCYYTPNREASGFGGSPDVATLNLIGDKDDYFGPASSGSVAAKVAAMKDQGGWGDPPTGNTFAAMKRQKIKAGLVCVLEGGRHDVSETHDNFLRDVLRAFLSSPHRCDSIVEQWKVCPYLSSKVHVIEQDREAPGRRTIVKVDTMDIDIKTPYGEELLLRDVKYSPGILRKKAKAAAEQLAHPSRKSSGSRAPPQSGEEFNVQLVRGARGWGFSIYDDDLEDVLQIEWIDPSGAVSAWNGRDPDHAVREHDFIAAVNGISGSLAAMCEALEGSEKVELLIRRVARSY